MKKSKLIQSRISFLKDCMISYWITAKIINDHPKEAHAFDGLFVSCHAMKSIIDHYKEGHSFIYEEAKILAKKEMELMQ